MVNDAHTLIRQNEPERAYVILDAVALKYGYTKEATEANELLTGLEPTVLRLWRARLESALLMFKMDTERYPTAAEGLHALIENPGVKSWHGPYWSAELGNALKKFKYIHDAPSGQMVVLK
jgi:general secretion pathway protein G